MAKLSIGMVLSQLMKEQNLSAINIADRTGKSRQNVYMDLKRTAMRDDHIEEWALALGVNKQVIYDLWNLEPSASESTEGSSYLMEHLKALEDQFKRLLNQLEVKDRQIEKLMDLLGKPEPATYMSKVIEFRPVVTKASCA